MQWNRYFHTPLLLAVPRRDQKPFRIDRRALPLQRVSAPRIHAQPPIGGRQVGTDVHFDLIFALLPVWVDTDGARSNATGRLRQPGTKVQIASHDSTANFAP